MLHTNPVLVRRTLAGLRERGLVAAEKGHGGGWVIARPLDGITLDDVYAALGEPELFAIGHRREQSPCLVEQTVNAALDQTMAEAEAMVRARLREVTLAALSEDFNRRHPSAHKGGTMEHTHPHVFDAAFWDQMYRDRHAAWDPEPNPYLPLEVADLEPGAALDVACGEGSDAIWLAKRGWHVTAVDISAVALDRGRAADVDKQVNWIQADLVEWQPPAEAYDLVSVHFMHFPPAERSSLFGRLAQAVRLNGTLLVVSHHVSDLETTAGRWAIPDLYFEADDVAAELSHGRWEILFGGTRPRSTTDREGRAIAIQDMVLKARRIE